MKHAGQMDDPADMLDIALLAEWHEYTEWQVYARANYPVEDFPTLWQMVCQRIQAVRAEMQKRRLGFKEITPK